MSAVFDAYAAYYDLFYQDKNYAAEAVYASELIRRHAPAARHLLELGCGTARHAIHLVEAGFRVHGIDRSRQMLQEAQSRLADAAPAVREAVVLAEADVTNFSLGRRFDAAVSLFHVVSYLSDDAALSTALGTIRRHLYTGAPFVFDFWYGPGVETEPPRWAERSATNAAGTVRRVSIPNWEPERHLVTVRFAIEVDEPGCMPRSVCEDHVMRYYYAEEIERELAAAGFALAGMTEWLSDRPPGPSTFSACAVAIAR
jgi:SAM-dependent methyltransferase